MFDYEEIKKAVMEKLDFLPEEEEVREAFLESLILLLMYP